MNHFAAAREEGTRLMSGSANCDDVVEPLVFEVLDRLGVLAADVDASFGHNLNGAGIEAMFDSAGGKSLKAIAFQRPGESFGFIGSPQVLAAMALV